MVPQVIRLEEYISQKYPNVTHLKRHDDDKRARQKREKESKRTVHGEKKMGCTTGERGEGEEYRRADQAMKQATYLS